MDHKYPKSVHLQHTDTGIRSPLFSEARATKKSSLRLTKKHAQAIREIIILSGRMAEFLQSFDKIPTPYHRNKEANELSKQWGELISELALTLY